MPKGQHGNLQARWQTTLARQIQARKSGYCAPPASCIVGFRKSSMCASVHLAQSGETCAPPKGGICRLSISASMCASPPCSHGMRCQNGCQAPVSQAKGTGSCLGCSVLAPHLQIEATELFREQHPIVCLCISINDHGLDRAQGSHNEMVNERTCLASHQLKSSGLQRCGLH